MLAATRRALRQPARLGAGPSRFCALAAASRARVRRPEVVAGGEAEAAAYLAPLPVALLRGRHETAALPEPLERLGIATLGELAALPRAAVADRFGAPGLLAHELARGRDGKLAPRQPPERLAEELELPEALSGVQLDRALQLLVDRLLARRERRGRTLRTVVLSAALVEGGTWRERVPFREALADPQRMRLALAQRLALLPAPAERLRLAVERFGPPASDQRSLLDEAGGGAPLAPARGGPPGACGRGTGRRAAGARGRGGLARARAPRRADAVRMSRFAAAAAPHARLAQPRRGARSRPIRSTAARSRSTAGRSMPCASRGSSRTAGGTAVRPPPLLGGRDDLRPQPRRLPRPARRRLVRAAVRAHAPAS